MSAVAPAVGSTLAAAASSPAKVILLGEHAVNRGREALATAVDLRVRCTVRARDDDRIRLVSGEHVAELDRPALDAFGAAFAQARESADPAHVAALAHGDFFGPARAILASLLARPVPGGSGRPPGMDVTWSGGPPVGCGLGSGAAAGCAMVTAASALVGAAPDAAATAQLAWLGDLIAHGGIASALDSSACAYGGVIAYTVAGGARALAAPDALELVVGDTGQHAPTAAVNAGVASRLAGRPALAHAFDDLALLVAAGRDALAAGDLVALGRLMHLNHLLLKEIGVSTDPIQRLVDAALEAGALGAKLSGSGGGGIVIALVPPGRAPQVTAAMQQAGGRAFPVSAAARGAHPEALERTSS